MKFLSVRDLRSNLSDAWKGLTTEREVVVTSNGRPIAILSAVTEDTLEETLAAFRRSRALAAVTEIQRQSARQGTDNLDPTDIDAEIAAVRQARRRRSDSSQ